MNGHDDALRDRLAEVLGEHRWTVESYGGTCGCGEQFGWLGQQSIEIHRSHVASALLPVLADVRAEAAQEALRAHREEWASYIENWSGSIGPEPPTVERIVAALRRPAPPFGMAANPGSNDRIGR